MAVGKIFPRRTVIKARGGSTPIVNPGATNPLVYGSVFASHANMTWLGAVWQATPKIAVRGAWFYTQVNDHAGGANLFTVGSEYSLTKNLLVYATAGEVAEPGCCELLGGYLCAAAQARWVAVHRLQRYQHQLLKRARFRLAPTRQPETCFGV